MLTHSVFGISMNLDQSWSGYICRVFENYQSDKWNVLFIRTAIPLIFFRQIWPNFAHIFLKAFSFWGTSFLDPWVTWRGHPPPTRILLPPPLVRGRRFLNKTAFLFLVCLVYIYKGVKMG